MSRENRYNIANSIQKGHTKPSEAISHHLNSNQRIRKKRAFKIKKKEENQKKKIRHQRRKFTKDYHTKYVSIYQCHLERRVTKLRNYSKKIVRFADEEAENKKKKIAT